jgi:hypothetical protein
MEPDGTEVKVPEPSIEEMEASNARIRAAIAEAKLQNAEHLLTAQEQIRMDQLKAENDRLLLELAAHQATAKNQGNTLSGIAAMRAAAGVPVEPAVSIDEVLVVEDSSTQSDEVAVENAPVEEVVPTPAPVDENPGMLPAPGGAS